MATITATLLSGTAVVLSNGRHEWKGDEPVELGGTDSGPTPYELLLGALASCTCITLAMYARHKGIALERVTTSYTFGRSHAKDCEDWDDPKKGFIETITSNVTLSGDFDAPQKKRLAQVAQRCPVHKTLATGVVITDEIEFA